MFVDDFPLLIEQLRSRYEQHSRTGARCLGTADGRAHRLRDVGPYARWRHRSKRLPDVLFASKRALRR